MEAGMDVKGGLIARKGNVGRHYTFLE